MDLQTALEQRKAAHRTGPRCSVCKFIESDHPAATDLATALTQEFTASMLEGALNDVGVVHIRAQTLQRHRRGACSG